MNTQSTQKAFEKAFFYVLSSHFINSKKYIATMVKLYLRSRWPFVFIIAYSLFAFALYAFNGIDIMIPCLWTTLTGVNCPGCGLTRALLLLFQFDFVGAWNMNPMIYIVAPALSYYIIKDFYSFRKRADQAKIRRA